MKKSFLLWSAAFLLALNIFCWKEVFVLNSQKYLKVDFLNVGQGDAAFIETPEMHQILIDGGPDSTILTKLQNLMPFWDRSIDLLILTHPEKDHMQGLIEILQRYKVDYVLWTGVVRNTPEFKKWQSVLNQNKNSKEIIADSKTVVKAGNAEIDVLYPFENLAGRELKKTSNDTAIVSKLIFGNNSFLFTGDITSVAEENIVKSNENIFSDVLKVAHHGSKYSTSDLFLENVKPKIAVISVGKNNYGHPTPEVLQKLNNFGIKIFRTDQNGDIKIISDGKSLLF